MESDVFLEISKLAFSSLYQPFAHWPRSKSALFFSLIRAWQISSTGGSSRLVIGKRIRYFQYFSYRRLVLHSGLFSFSTLFPSDSFPVFSSALLLAIKNSLHLLEPGANLEDLTGENLQTFPPISSWNVGFWRNRNSTQGRHKAQFIKGLLNNGGFLCLQETHWLVGDAKKVADLLGCVVVASEFARGEKGGVAILRPFHSLWIIVDQAILLPGYGISLFLRHVKGFTLVLTNLYLDPSRIREILELIYIPLQSFLTKHLCRNKHILVTDANTAPVFSSTHKGTQGSNPTTDAMDLLLQNLSLSELLLPKHVHTWTRLRDNALQFSTIDRAFLSQALTESSHIRWKIQIKPSLVSGAEHAALILSNSPTIPRRKRNSIPKILFAGSSPATLFLRALLANLTTTFGFLPSSIFSPTARPAFDRFQHPSLAFEDDLLAEEHAIFQTGTLNDPISEVISQQMNLLDKETFICDKDRGSLPSPVATIIRFKCLVHTWAASLPFSLSYTKVSFLALRQQVTGLTSGTIVLSGPLIKQFGALHQATRGDLSAVPTTISVEALSELLLTFDAAKTSPFEAPAPWLAAPKFGISTTKRSKAFTILGHVFPNIGPMKPLKTQTGVELKSPQEMIKELQSNRFSTWTHKGIFNSYGLI